VDVQIADGVSIKLTFVRLESFLPILLYGLHLHVQFEMREITSILNVRLCTAAGMSPFRNRLCERVHAITDVMLIIKD
jgi:hypothetical protein